MVLYLVLATEEVLRPWGIIRKAAIWKCVWRGKGTEQLESTLLVLYRESRDLIISAKIVL